MADTNTAGTPPAETPPATATPSPQSPAPTASGVVVSPAPIDESVGKPTPDQPGSIIPDAAKPAETTPAATAPQTYADFKLPDDMPMDKSVLDSFLPMFKEANMTQEQAQKFIDHQAGLVKAGMAAQAAAFDEQVNNWVTATKADKELGGPNYEKSLQTAQIAVGKFASPGLLTLLKDSGLDKHPEMIRTFAKIGQLMREDNPGNVLAPVKKELSTEERLYPNDVPQARH